MTSTELKQVISDIYHLEKVNIFPPSLFVSSILCLLIAIIIFLYLFNRNKHNWYKEAKEEINKILNKEKVSNKEVVLLIKKLALQKFPRTEISKLYGEDLNCWLQSNISKKFAWHELQLKEIYQKEDFLLERSKLDELNKILQKWL